MRALLLLLLWIPCALFARVPEEEKILICGVCKDVESAIPSIISNAEKLGRVFKDYAVIIYENNSKDQTVPLLKNWAKKNRRVRVISEQLSQDDFMKMGARCFSHDGKPSRMELIARARNIVLDRAKEARYQDFRYLLMVDLDFQGKWPQQAILSTIKSRRPWDCVSANGVDLNGVYYDNYALRDADHPIGPELIGDEWWTQKAPKREQLDHKKRWHPVYSAFGGLAIYKRKKIVTCRYFGAVTEELLQDYKQIIRHTSSKNYYFNKYCEWMGITPKMALKKTPIRFQLNSGYYEFPVCCEHVTLHAEMRQKGWRRMYINPEMVMQYSG